MNRYREPVPPIPQRPTQDIDRTRAACRNGDPELFYSDHPDDKVTAKTICSSCDIRNECLEFALAFGDRWGIWGGLDKDERWQLRKKQAAVA